MRLSRLAVAATLAFISAPAHAELNWCRFMPLLPSITGSFEQSAAGLDQLGCQSAPVDSAHTRAWLCTDRAQGDTSVILLRIVSTSRYAVTGNDPVFLIVTQDDFGDLDRLRQCPGFRASGTRQPFVPGSIAARDSMIVTHDYRVRTVHLLNVAGTGRLISASSDRMEGEESVALAERITMGITRSSYPTTSVEIAGANLIRSAASDIIVALEGRGARVTGRTEPVPGLMVDTTLSPPTGLDGVLSVIVRSFNRHVDHVRYRLNGEANYMTYVGLLDARYGRSSPRNGTGQFAACRYRSWTSGDVTVTGSFCPDTGHSIWFNNMVVDRQSEQFNARLDERSRSPQTPQRPRIDPDNL